METIDRSSPVPLYRQIRDIVLDEIQREGIPTSSITERALVTRFKVSRAPVRQALKELADEGFLYRQRGQGTFPVKGLLLNPPALQLGGLTKQLEAEGVNTENQVLGSGRISATTEIASKLDLGPGAEVFWTSRTISMEGKTLIWSQIYLNVPATFSPSRTQLDNVNGIFDLLDLDPALALAMGQHTIYASSASAEDASILGIELGAPILVTETSMYTREGTLEGFRRLVHPAVDYKMVFTVNR